MLFTSFHYESEENDKERVGLAMFDFIIVGGGTSGCVLANRLSESGHYSVLLLEAGGIPPEFMNVPGLAKQNELIPELTFEYFSVPQKHAALGVNGGVVRVSLGKVLGGTSQINYSIFNRGNSLDFDNWANYIGDSSRSYSAMLPHFIKSESYLGEFPSTHHGSSGPIPVSFQEYAPGRQQWLDSGKLLGYQIKDANGPQQISFTPIEFARKRGRRVSAYKGYLEPIMNTRKNLKIITYANVTQILFAGNTAIGVRYNINGSLPKFGDVAVAKREIILSAGTYNSALLIMRSGIGPKDQLLSVKIPIIQELPVGESLMEHPVVPIHIVLNNKSLALDPQKDFNKENYEQYERFGTGPYSSVAGYAGQAFISSSVAAKEGHWNWPDIQLCLTSVTTRLNQFKDNWVEPWETTVLMNLYLARQKSRGTVKLNPNNLFVPVIDFNYIADERDKQILLEGVKETLRIFEETDVYERLRARLFREPLEACKEHEFNSDNYWRCYIRQTTIPGNHPSSTCAMGDVVDSKLRVIGVNKLRVVDASVMPFSTDSNLHAAIFGIAEKAADEILNDSFI